MLKHARLKFFYRLLKPFSDRKRLRRMQVFVRVMSIRPGTRILDLGGTPHFWSELEIPCEITIVNLPGAYDGATFGDDSRHSFKFVNGDACDVSQFEANAFDISFSNSVIEHVGDRSRRKSMAGEVLRLAPRYWVETPSKFFPIEAHCGMPFWWFYPQSVRDYFIRRWRTKLPKWTDMVETTDIVLKAEILKLFPEGTILTERSVGIPKSYIVYKA